MARLAHITLAIALALGPAAQAAAADQPVRLAIDPEGSEVTFLMETTWHEVHGTARGITGTIESAGGSLFADAVVTFVVDATTMETGNGRRDKTMHADYMMTSEWPRITFRSTAPPVLLGKDAGGGAVSLGKEPGADAGAVSFELAGDLTVRSETRGVILSLTARPDGDGWVVTGEHIVSLRDYGIPDPSIFLNKVQDAVKVTFSVRARPA